MKYKISLVLFLFLLAGNVHAYPDGSNSDKVEQETRLLADNYTETPGAQATDTTSVDSEDLDDLVGEALEEWENKPEKGSDLTDYAGWVVALALILWRVVVYFRKKGVGDNK